LLTCEIEVGRRLKASRLRWHLKQIPEVVEPLLNTRHDELHVTYKDDAILMGGNKGGPGACDLDQEHFSIRVIFDRLIKSCILQLTANSDADLIRIPQPFVQSQLPNVFSDMHFGRHMMLDDPFVALAKKVPVCLGGINAEFVEWHAGLSW
jgi:hypothetical protein